MTLEEIEAAFKAHYPKAVDFRMYEYDDRAADIAQLAQAHGYRFAGYRLERAVFSTKPARGELQKNQK
jgi:hypothetical protein